MCFRPAEVAAPQVCPDCGKEIAIIAGIRQTKCPFCGAELPPEEEIAAAPGVAAPGAPASAPGAPAAPSAPGAPAAPSAPSAPAAAAPAAAPAKPAKPAEPVKSANPTGEAFNPFG